METSNCFTKPSFEFTRGNKHTIIVREGERERMIEIEGKLENRIGLLSERAFSNSFFEAFPGLVSGGQMLASK